MNKKVFLILSLCAVFVFWVSGSVTSGFHFMDDHGLVRTDNELESRSFLSVAINMMSGDMNIRFRSFDRFRTVAETWAFGINFTQHAVFRFILAFASLCFFAVFWASLLKNYWLGALFSIFTIFGPQASMFWMLGPAEAWGVFFVAAALCVCAHNPSKRTFFSRAAFFALILLSTLCKESFILFAPAAYAIYVYFEYENGERNLRSSITKNLPFGLLMAIVVLAELYIILSFVGTEKIGYAGIQVKSVAEYVKTLVRLLMTNSATVAIAILSLVFVAASPKTAWDSLRKEFFGILCLTGIGLFAVVPQIALYAKSGIFGRYLLPGMIGVNLLLCVPVRIILNQEAFLQKGLGNLILSVISVMGASVSALFLLSDSLRMSVLMLLAKFSRSGYMFAPELWLEIWNGHILTAAIWALMAFLLMLFLTFTARKTRVKISALAYFVVVIAAASLVWSSYRDAKLFADEGIATNKFLSRIGELTDENSKILIVSEPAINLEWTSSLRTYIELVLHRKNINNLLTISDYYKQDDFMMLLRNGLVRSVENTRVEDIGGFDCIAILPTGMITSNEKILLEKFPELRSANYKREQFIFPVNLGEDAFLIYFK